MGRGWGSSQWGWGWGGLESVVVGLVGEAQVRWGWGWGGLRSGGGGAGKWAQVRWGWGWEVGLKSGGGGLRWGWGCEVGLKSGGVGLRWELVSLFCLLRSGLPHGLLHQPLCCPLHPQRWGRHCAAVRRRLQDRLWHSCEFCGHGYSTACIPLCRLLCGLNYSPPGEW